MERKIIKLRHLLSPHSNKLLNLIKMNQDTVETAKTLLESKINEYKENGYSTQKIKSELSRFEATIEDADVKSAFESLVIDFNQKSNIIHFQGEISVISNIESTLSIDNCPDGKMSFVTLDIEDVIITRRIEKLLYHWMESYDLDVIDTTLEKPKTRWDKTLQKIVQDEPLPMTFRQKALDEFKQRLKIKKLILDITKFFEEVDGKRVFTKEYSARKLIELINERIESGNMLRLMINLTNVGDSKNNMESIIEIASFLIFANEFVEIYGGSASSHVTKFKVLPAISYLCFNFSSVENAWIDIKSKFVEGTEMYISTSPDSYRRAKVIESIHHDENGKLIMDKDPSEWTKADIENFYSIKLEYVDSSKYRDEDESDVAEEEVNSQGDKEVKLKEFVLQKLYLNENEAFVFPVEIFENIYEYDNEGNKIIETIEWQGKEYVKYPGIPTKEELAFNRTNSKFKDTRDEVKLTEAVSYLISSDGYESTETDRLQKYREGRKKLYKEQGIEVPEIDLIKIMEGEPSPFDNIFKKHNNLR